MNIFRIGLIFSAIGNNFFGRFSELHFKFLEELLEDIFLKKIGKCHYPTCTEVVFEKHICFEIVANL